METLNRKQYGIRLITLYISTILTFIICTILLFSTFNASELGEAALLGLGSIGMISFLLLGILYLILITINISFLKKRLYDIGISKWWSILVLIPIFGQIFSIAMIYPKSKTENN